MQPQRLVKKEGEEVLQAHKEDHGLSTWSPWRTVWEQMSRLQPMEDPMHMDIPWLELATTQGDPTQEQTPGRRCGPVKRSSCISKFSGRTCDLWWINDGAACSWRPTFKQPIAGAIFEELQPRGGTQHRSSVWRTAFCVRDPTLEERTSMRRSGI